MPLEITDPFPTAGGFVEMVAEALADLPEAPADPLDGRALVLDELSVDLPFEMTVEAGPDGALRIGTSPPTQLVETSVMPVWHRVRLRIAAEPAEAEDGDG